jgi:hypothetical protein
MSGSTVQAAFPTGPLLEADGSLSSAWRGFFLALYNRTGAAPGAPAGVTQAALDAETAARIAGDHNLQVQIDAITGAASNIVTMQRGVGASDSVAMVNVTLPRAYTIRTLSFACDGNPTEPTAYFNIDVLGGAITTTNVIGKLSKLDISSGTIIDLPGVNFTWYATGV